jgi:hypothetical protein
MEQSESSILMICNRPHRWGTSITSNLRLHIAGLLRNDNLKANIQTFNFTTHFIEQIRQELISQIFEELKEGKKLVSNEELLESVIICDLKLHQDYINHFMRPILQRDFSKFLFSILEELTKAEFDDTELALNHLNAMKTMSEHPYLTCIIDFILELESILHKVTLLGTYKNGLSSKISLSMLCQKSMNKELVKEPFAKHIIFGLLGAGFQKAEQTNKINFQDKDLKVWRKVSASILIIDIIGYFVQPFSGKLLTMAKVAGSKERFEMLDKCNHIIQKLSIQLQDSSRTTAAMIEIRDMVNFHLKSRLKPFNELLCEYMQGILDGKWKLIEKNFESNLEWFFNHPEDPVEPEFLKLTFQDIKVGDDEFVFVDSLDLNPATNLKNLQTSFIPPKKQNIGKYDI